MNKTITRSWTATKEALAELEEISRYIGEATNSATIRYCIKQIYKQIKKEA